MRRASAWVLIILATAALVVVAGWTRNPAIVARLPHVGLAFAAADLAIVAMTFLLVRRASVAHLLLAASPAVIALLRRQLGYDGVLITDDASMAAYRADLPGNVVSTLKGGADLILASYDPDVAFTVLARLVVAAREDADLRRALAESDRRLAGGAFR